MVKKPKIIVGIDPGATCGLSILSLSGEPILIDSYRVFTKADLISMIAAQGDPVIVAVDVQNLPDFAESVARKFEASLFIPPAPLSTLDKQKIVQEYSGQHEIDLEDQHQKDSLAAALKAFKHFKNKFERAVAHIQEAYATVPVEEVKALIVKGFSTAEAIELLKTEKKTVEAEVKTEGISKPKIDYERVLHLLKAKIRDQNLRIMRLKGLSDRRLQEIQNLKGQIEKLDRKISEIKTEEHFKIRTEHEHSKLTSEIQTLKRKVLSLEEDLEKTRSLTLEDLKRMVTRGTAAILKLVSVFSQEEIERVSKRVGIEQDDIVFLTDASGGGSSTAKLFIEKGVKAIIVGSNMSHPAFEEFLKADIPVIGSDELSIQWIENVSYVKTEEIRKVINAFKNSLKEERGKQVESVVEEYKRGKDV
ncbi:MAG: DUF460 domain-containing protein [Candidatus Bathyarchaeota archaeon]